MKDTKRRFPPQTFYDRTGIQRELETQAEKGWYLEKCSSLGWIYRRGEAKKVHYAVTYFPKADVYDPAPSEEQLRFQEFCAHTGWELVASNAQMQIFRNHRENPIPIETDPVIDVENIHASMKKILYPSWISGIVLSALQLRMQLLNFSSQSVEYLSTGLYMFLALLWLMLLIHYATMFLAYLSWLRTARRNAADGLFTDTKGASLLQRFFLALCSVIGILLLFSMSVTYGREIALISIGGVLGIVGISLLFTWVMKKKKMDADTNRALSSIMTALLTFVFMVVLVFGTLTVKPNAQGEPYTAGGHTEYIYREEIPLKVEYLLETDYENYSYEILSQLSSPLLGYQWCQQYAMADAPEEPEMDYVIVDVKAPFLRDWAVEQMLEDTFHLNPARGRTCQALDAAPWGAVEVYQLLIDGEPRDHYLVCYETRIVKLDLSWTPTPEQMAVISAILNK